MDCKDYSFTFTEQYDATIVTSSGDYLIKIS